MNVLQKLSQGQSYLSRRIKGEGGVVPDLVLSHKHIGACTVHRGAW